MKKFLTKLSLILSVFMMILSLTTGNVFATNSSQDGLVVNTNNDKETYKKGEKATTTISVTNTNSYDMEDITINVTLPDELSASETNFKIPILKTNETKEYKVTVESNNSVIITTPTDTVNSTDSIEHQDVNTSDDISNNILLGLFLLVGMSSIVILVITKKRHGKRFFIIVLISTMAISGLSIKNVYAESSRMLKKRISLMQPLNYENQNYNLNIYITYFIPNDEIITSGEITREEWITKLVDLFDYQTNLTEYSFLDYEDANNPDKIETAIQYSIIDIKENELFNPKGYATREFVAYTTIHALRLSNTSNGSLYCTDKDNLQYPNEDYLAIQNGMLNLINNQFKPNKYVSNDEVNQVIKVIKEIINSTKIDESNKDYIDYQDDVKVIEDTFEQTSNNTILLDDDNKIQKGDLVVINGNQADGIAMKVENVQEQENQLQIQYSQPSLEDILESIHVEEIADNSNATFTPADGVIVENQSSTRSRDKYDSIPLDKELKLKTDMNDLSASISLNLNEIQYRFDVDYSLFGGLQVHDAYLALDTDVNANITYQGSENLIEREETEKIKKKIGDINVPLQFGFNASFEVYAVATIDGKIEINVTLANTIGFQYINNNFRTIAETKQDLAQMEISASARFGIQPEAGVEWLGFDIANVNGSVGIGADGSVKNQLVSPYQFCIDAKVYLYATVGAELIPDVTDKLKIDKDIFTSSKSPFKFNAHFEESGKVDKCTRDDSEEETENIVVNKGETIRISSNALANDYIPISTILSSEANTIIDYAFYNPAEIDIVNGYAYTNLLIKEKFNVSLYSQDFVDITVIDGKITIEKEKVNKLITIEKIQSQALVKYTLNQGDTMTFKQKEGIDFKKLGLSVYGYVHNGSAHVKEHIFDFENDYEQILEYDYDKNNSYGEDSFDSYCFKQELEFHENIRKTEVTIECTSGTITVYLRSENMGEVEISR